MVDRVLMVGINKYPGCPLSGCVNDVTDMANLLVDQFGFASSSIQLLTDERATTKAILAKLGWLVQDAKAGDRLLFHYSGHGAQVAALSGEQVKGMDDCICPVDFDWSESRLIRDLTFHQLFSSLPEGVKFNWVSDSCHSGSLDRDMLPPPNKKLPPNKRPKIFASRCMPVPADIAWNHHRVAKDAGHVSRNIHRTAVEKALPVGFVSGCRDRETSSDAAFGGRPNGALTYFLLKALKSAKDKPLTAVVDAVRADLKKNGYTQVPQVDGERTNVPFLA